MFRASQMCAVAVRSRGSGRASLLHRALRQPWPLQIAGPWSGRGLWATASRRSARCFSTDSTSPSDGNSLATLDELFQSETVSYLRDPASNRELFLIGTAHVSKKSAEDVRRIIRLTCPHFVLLELCDARLRVMRQKMRQDKNKREKETSEEMGDAVAELLQKIFGGGKWPWSLETVLNKVLKTGLKQLYHNIFRQYGLVPGGEFHAAIEEVEATPATTPRAELVTIDRGQAQTMDLLRQALFKVSWIEAFSTPVPPELQAQEEDFVRSYQTKEGFEQMVEKLKSRKQIRLLRGYLTDVAPQVMDVMLTSRDEMMAARIQGVGKGDSSQSRPSGSTTRIIAIVGMAHMDGIEARLGWDILNRR